MTDTADTLHAAAARLRALDQAATPGPWVHFKARGMNHIEGPLFVLSRVDGRDALTDADADLIVTLRAVAAPLADWLDDAAAFAAAWEAQEPSNPLTMPTETAVAHAVLGVTA